MDLRKFVVCSLKFVVPGRLQAGGVWDLRVAVSPWFELVYVWVTKNQEMKTAKKK
jgi:hypothetical protein